jgi:integrase/recombinase XerD
MNRPSPARVQVPGPLEAYAGSFRDTGLDPSELTVSCADRFVGHRRAASRVHRCLTLHGMGPLLDHLRRIGVVPAPERVNVLGGRAQLIEEFVGYLIVERGLAVSTVGNYRSVADRFLAGCRWQGEDLVGVSAEAVNVFVLSEAARRSPGSLNNVTTGLRALLRFLYLYGDTEAQLVDAVPVAPGWRDRGLTSAVAPCDVARMLDGCDRRTTVGCRDFAILTVLVRLGLRSGEVAALSVDDIIWQIGELTVTGKGNRRDRGRSTWGRRSPTTAGMVGEMAAAAACSCVRRPPMVGCRVPESPK